MNKLNRARLALLRVVDPSGARELERLLLHLERQADARTPRIELHLDPDGFATLAGGGLFQPLGMPAATLPGDHHLVRVYPLNRAQIIGLIAVLCAAVTPD